MRVHGTFTHAEAGIAAVGSSIMSHCLPPPPAPVLRHVPHSGGCCRLPRELLQEYSRHVDVLSTQLLKPDVPAYCSIAPPAALLQQVQQQSGSSGLGQPGSAPAAGTPAAPPRPAAVPPLVPVAAVQRPAAAAAVPADNNLQPKAVMQSGAQPAAASSRLQTQQQLHVSAAAARCKCLARVRLLVLAVVLQAAIHIFGSTHIRGMHWL